LGGRDSGDDVFRGGSGSEYVGLGSVEGDADRVYGGPNAANADEELDVEDGDFLDVLNGGGGFDECAADVPNDGSQPSDVMKNCEGHD
jgi:hypothetical protein